MRSEVASGVGYGAIGGAASAALTPFVANAVTGGDPNITSGQTAAIGGIATLVGGLAAGLAGQNAMGGASAGQNEVLNNDTASQDHIADAVKNGGFGSAALTLLLYTAMPWLPGNPMAQAAGSAATSIVQGLVGQIQSHNGGNTPSTGAAPVTACDPPFCEVVPASPGAPGNALLSKGGDNGESELEGNSGGTSAAQTPAPNESADGVPGRVQSRINVTSDGMAHIGLGRWLRRYCWDR